MIMANVCSTARDSALPPAAARWRTRIWRLVKRGALVLAGGITMVVGTVTAASTIYNFATNGTPPRPPGLMWARGGGFDTRYLAWGTHGSPIVLVPGAFETAATFDALGTVLGTDHRVFAIDLTGTGYSTPSPPYTAEHMATQLLAFLVAKGLTGVNAPVLVGHSAGAAVVGLAALRGPRFVRGVVFLDGDATPISVPTFVGWLLINPYRTTLMRLALSSDWLIRQLYNAQCGPGCPPLSAAGVEGWRLPLQQPGFEPAETYQLRHGIPVMSNAQFAALRATPTPKLVVFGGDDDQMSGADAIMTAKRIGAPPPVAVPGRHLTMISSPKQVAAALQTFAASTRRSCRSTCP
jgi:pimeloyl-ACP methyl ester carboxylesterase